MTFLSHFLRRLAHRLSRSCYRHRLRVSLPLTCIQFLHHTHHIDTRVNHLSASSIALTRAALFIREAYFVTCSLCGSVSDQFFFFISFHSLSLPSRRFSLVRSREVEGGWRVYRNGVGLVDASCIHSVLPWEPCQNHGFPLSSFFPLTPMR